jgi:hypothetical protein
MYKLSSYVTENMLSLHYRDKLVNALKGDRCLFWESYQMYKYSMWSKWKVFMLKRMVHS